MQGVMLNDQDSLPSRESGYAPKPFYGFSPEDRARFSHQQGVCTCVLPVLIYYALFCYATMYGAQIAFKKLHASPGHHKEPLGWVPELSDFFVGVYFWRLRGNTLRISLSYMVIGFPHPDSPGAFAQRSFAPASSSASREHPVPAPSLFRWSSSAPS
jgi:hypothetical protein